LIESIECLRQRGCQVEKVPLKMTSGSTFFGQSMIVQVPALAFSAESLPPSSSDCLFQSTT